MRPDLPAPWRGFLDDLDARLDTLDYTPRIRTLLQEAGVTFENALVPVSLCCPSRVSLLRGQYVHNHQVLSNGPPDGGFQKATELNLEQTTLATLLQDAGYTTALMGKYLNGYPYTDALTYIPPGWNEFYSPSSDAAYFGFNYTLNANGTLVSYGSAPEDYMTDVLSRTAVNFITRTAGAGTPLFLYVNTYAPHGPSTPAPRHSGLFTDISPASRRDRASSHTTRVDSEGHQPAPPPSSIDKSSSGIAASGTRTPSTQPKS